MKTNGYYIDVNDSNFYDSVKPKERLVLLKFGAEWSGPCHIIDPIIEELSYEYNSQVTFFKVDVDRHFTIKKDYGISKVPTLLFLKEGKVLDHVEGAVPKKIITDKLTKLLENQI